MEPSKHISNLLDYKDAIFDYSASPKTILNFDKIFIIESHLGSGRYISYTR